MYHKDLLINHILESWQFANAAARNAAGTYASGDVGRVSFQMDTGQYYRLTSPAPTWQLIAPYTPLAVGYASAQVTTAANPPGLATTAGLMMGYGTPSYGPFLFTPTATGKMHLLMTFGFSASVDDAILVCGLKYGAAPAPVHGAVVIGSSGTTYVRAGSAPAGTEDCITLTFLAKNLTIGQQYWCDVVVQSAVAGPTMNTTGAYFTAVELP